LRHDGQIGSNQTVAGLKLGAVERAMIAAERFKSDRCGIEIN